MVPVLEGPKITVPVTDPARMDVPAPVWSKTAVESVPVMEPEKVLVTPNASRPCKPPAVVPLFTMLLPIMEPFAMSNSTSPFERVRVLVEAPVHVPVPTTPP